MPKYCFNYEKLNLKIIIEFEISRSLKVKWRFKEKVNFKNQIFSIQMFI